MIAEHAPSPSREAESRGGPALFALAAGGFGIGLTEFVIVGLLPSVAKSLSIRSTTASVLVSGYAISVAVGAIVLTVLTTRLKPKPLLMSLMVLFIAGNTLSAAGPTFATILAGRIVAALCHGTFFGVGAVLATTLVPAHRRAWAISIMFGGLTIANVLGVPLGTVVGQAAGWRWTFYLIAAAGVLALLGIAAFIPADAGTHEKNPPLKTQFLAFRNPQVWLSLLLTVLGFGGVFGAFTYIAFTLTDVSGFPSHVIPALLVLFGAGLFAGNSLGGRAADRRLFPTLLLLLCGLTVVLVVFGLVAGSPAASVVCLVLMGGCGFGTVPGLQLRTLRYAGGGQRLTSAANIAAFNVGNTLGAWICGWGVAAGDGYRSSLFIGAGFSAAAVVVLLIGTVLPGAPVTIDGPSKFKARPDDAIQGLPGSEAPASVVQG